MGAWLAPAATLVGAAGTLVSAGWGFVLPSVDGAMTDLVPAQFRAGALSLRNSTTFLGRATGPVLFATLAPGTGYRVVLLAAGVGSLAFGVLTGLATRGVE